MQLNPPQQEAVLHAHGPLLVFAGAGSGKTSVITYRVANLMSEHRVPPYRILAVTFTNKAAAELKERLERIAGSDLAQDLWVGTFHSICCRLLRRYHDEVNLERSFVIYDDSDQKAIVTRIIRKIGLDERAYPPKVLLSRIHRQKQEGKRPSEVERSPTLDDTFVDIYQRYETALNQANAVDFDDLILHIMRIAEDKTSQAGRELRDRFDFLLVDEFQDTNRIQYRLVRALAAQSRNLCVVGDDDQSIYSWRGADIRNIRGYKTDFHDATIVKLEQNYRSSGNVVKAALGVIEPSIGREPKQLFTEAPDGEPVLLRAVRDERDEASAVVSSIQKEISAGRAPDEIAVFYRINAQSRVLEEAFRSEQLPYQIIGGMKFFDRAEVKDALGYLRLIENPRSDADLIRVINTPTRGIGNKTVEKLLELASSRGTSAYDAIDAATEGKLLGTAAKKKLLAFRDLIEELRQARVQLSPQELASQVLDQTAYRQLLRDQDTAEADARLENLEEFVGSIGEYEAEAETANETPGLSGYLERISLVADIDAADGGPTVLLMTVHAAKGLEFESVYLTGMEEEMFPYRGLDGESADELEEERRLAYVAITRAKQQLTVSYAGSRTIFGKTHYQVPSRFLTDIPDEATKREGNSWAPKPRLAYGNYNGRSQTDYDFDQRPSQVRNDGWGATSQRTRSTPTEEPRVDYEMFSDLPDEESARVKRGSKVFHKRFGKGIVQRIEPGTDPKVVAKFPGYGEKKVSASFLSFE